MKIEQVVLNVGATLTGNKNDFPVPNDYEMSLALGIYKAGVEAMREAAMKQARTAGLNGLANEINDIVVG